MKPIEPPEPTRINVTLADAEAARAALEAAGALTFEQQKEEVRRLNSIMLARVGAKVVAGNVDDDTILALLTRTSTIAKTWSTEERQAGGASDPDDVAALQRLAKRAG